MDKHIVESIVFPNRFLVFLILAQKVVTFHADFLQIRICLKSKTLFSRQKYFKMPSAENFSLHAEGQHMLTLVMLNKLGCHAHF